MSFLRLRVKHVSPSEAQAFRAARAEESGYSGKTLAHQLARFGVAVLPMSKSPEKVMRAFKEAVETFPEYKDTSGDLVLGGFGALGTPSSFHNRFARDARKRAQQVALPIFSALVNTLGESAAWKLEQLPDRTLIRREGQTPSAELWHVDAAPAACKGDMIFGGWFNPTDKDSHFSCHLGSHKHTAAGHTGFSVFPKKVTRGSKTEEEYQSALHRMDETRRVLNASRSIVVIPPGCLLIFNERLIHEVFAKKVSYDILRVFIGWRLTKSDESLLGNSVLRKLVADMAVMPLKSGQIPPMYAALHWVNWPDKLLAFSKKMHPRCVGERTVATGKRKGQTLQVVHRHMRSLKEYGWGDTYPPYTETEIELHLPRKSWTVRGKAMRL